MARPVLSLLGVQYDVIVYTELFSFSSGGWGYEPRYQELKRVVVAEFPEAEVSGFVGRQGALTQDVQKVTAKEYWVSQTFWLKWLFQLCRELWDWNQRTAGFLKAGDQWFSLWRWRKYLLTLAEIYHTPTQL